MARKLRAAFFLAVLFLAPSCGYRLAGQENRLPETIRTIYVSIFVNDTKEPNLELLVTNAIIEKFKHDGRLGVASAKDADSVLSGTIEKYSLEPLVYDAYNNAAKYRLRMRVKVKFEDKTGKGVLVEKSIASQWDYIVGASIIADEMSRVDAVNQASAYTGDKILGLLLEGF
ncbi:MAG: LptE family protein [Nitrospinae bacterium]|nr:LptE family protein [Nitrospinota bacterium]